MHFALLAGNIVGGRCIFAPISHAQVRGDEAVENGPQDPESAPTHRDAR